MAKRENVGPPTQPRFQTATPAARLSNDRDMALDSEPKLRQVGLRVTLPRKRVLEMIRNSPSRHLSAEDIYRSLLEQRMDVGMATVYRVLSQLEGAGLLLRHVFDGGRAVFEYNEGVHHDHLICVSCGRVDEFTNEKIEALQREVASEYGYRLADHRLALFGFCPDCQTSRRAMRTPTAR